MTASADAALNGGANSITRREFLNYAWLATIGVVTAEFAVVTYVFALPRLGPGAFGGSVPVGNVDALPVIGADPLGFAKAKFWWVLNDEGARAIYKVCTHLGCIYKWKTDQNKFICPCHGSQFTREGLFIQGPAPRHLDSFVIRAVDPSTGLELSRTPEEGGPVEIPSGAQVIIETGMKIIGAPRG
jgi:cytochrome b6-f complex iron-sulfur subunit